LKFEAPTTVFRTLSLSSGLRLKKFRLQTLFVYEHDDDLDDDENPYVTDPERIEFRQVLLDFIKIQATTLEYFALCMCAERCFPGLTPDHFSPQERAFQKEPHQAEL